MLERIHGVGWRPCIRAARETLNPSKRTWLLGLLAALALISTPLWAQVWITRQARAHIFKAVETVPPRATAIVLGARVYGRGRPSPILEDRLRMALELYSRGLVKKILVSGDHQSPHYDEVNTMRDWLTARGVPSRAIFLDHAGFRTHDTMVRAVRVFQIQSAIICTQRFHLPRALYLAQNAGLDAVGIAVDRRHYADEQWNAWRERAASVVAILDVLLGTQPRHLGQPVPIDGPARASHDEATTEPNQNPQKPRPKEMGAP